MTGQLGKKENERMCGEDCDLILGIAISIKTEVMLAICKIYTKVLELSNSF